MTWESDLFGVGSRDAAVGTDAQASNEEEQWSEAELIRRIWITMAEDAATLSQPTHQSALQAAIQHGIQPAIQPTFQPVLQPALQLTVQPAVQPASDGNANAGMDGVELGPGDREDLRELEAMDEDDDKNKDEAGEEGEKMEEDEKGEAEQTQAATVEEDDLYECTPPSSPLSPVPENLVDPREDASMQVQDSQLPAGEAPLHPAPQWESAFAPPAGYVASMADPTVSTADAAESWIDPGRSIQPWEGDTPTPDPLGKLLNGDHPRRRD